MKIKELLAMQLEKGGMIDPIFRGKPGEYMMVVGPSGVGKSYFVTDLACCLASGLPWLGFPIDRPHTVSIIALEGSLEAHQERAEVFSRSYPDIIEQVNFEWAAPFYIDHKANTISHMRQLVSGCDIAILDPMKYVVKDYINSESAMQFTKDIQFVSEELGVPIIMTHHVKKPGGERYLLDPDDLSQCKGPTDYTDHASTVLIFDRTRQSRGGDGKFGKKDDNKRTVYFSKTRDARGGIDPKDLEWDRDTFKFNIFNSNN